MKLNRTNKLNKTNKKITSLIFAALMITSIFAGFVMPVVAVETKPNDGTIEVPLEIQGNSVVKSSTAIAPVVSESTGDLGALSHSTNTIWTRTVTIRRTFRSLVGLTVATHDATTWWTFGNNWLFASPRGMANDWWTLPPTFATGNSAQWDWYHVGLHGTGRSNMQVTFVFGVPTPWGPIGSTFSSRIFTTVRADGTFEFN